MKNLIILFLTVTLLGFAYRDFGEKFWLFFYTEVYYRNQIAECHSRGKGYVFMVALMGTEKRRAQPWEVWKSRIECFNQI